MKPSLPVAQPSSKEAPQKQPFLTPSSLKSSLFITVFLLIIGSGVAYYLSFVSLSEYARTVQQASVDAKASTDQIQTLQLLRAQLAQNSSLLTTADAIFAPTSSAASIAEADLRRYAQLAGVEIKAITKLDTNNPSSTVLSVELTGPINYQNFSAFLVGIENNVPKLQVTSLSLARTEQGDQVTVSSLQIKVYTE